MSVTDFWSHDKIKQLIELRGIKYSHLFKAGLQGNFKEEPKIWKKIEQDLEVDFSTEKILRKWKLLLNRYKKMKTSIYNESNDYKNKITKKWKYYDLMDRVLKDKFLIRTTTSSEDKIFSIIPNIEKELNDSLKFKKEDKLSEISIISNLKESQETCGSFLNDEFLSKVDDKLINLTDLSLKNSNEEIKIKSGEIFVSSLNFSLTFECTFCCKNFSDIEEFCKHLRKVHLEQFEVTKNRKDNLKYSENGDQQIKQNENNDDDDDSKLNFETVMFDESMVPKCINSLTTEESEENNDGSCTKYVLNGIKMEEIEETCVIEKNKNNVIIDSISKIKIDDNKFYSVQENIDKLDLDFKAYKCNLCNCSYLKNSSLNRHMKVKHKNVNIHSTGKKFNLPENVSEDFTVEQQKSKNENIYNSNDDTLFELEKLEDNSIEHENSCIGSNINLEEKHSNEINADDLEEMFDDENKVDSNSRKSCDDLEDLKKNYKCTLCHLNYVTFGRYMTHVRIKHSNYSSQLLDEGKEIGNFENSKNKEEMFACHLCMCTYSKSFYLRSHIKTKHQNNVFEKLMCKICKKLFKTEWERDDHLNSCIQRNNILECQFCNVSYLKYQHYLTHLEKKHSNEIQSNVLDNLVLDKKQENESTKMDEITSHKKKEENQLKRKRTFKCSLCKNRFSYYHYLQRHMKIKHSHENLVVEQFICNLCKQLYKTKEECDEHKSSCIGEAPKKYQCKICGKKTNYKLAFHDHMLIHKGIKPHKCYLCEKSFTSLVNLKVHIRRHLGEKRHKCAYCDKSFVTTTARTIHERRHTGEKPYQCTECGQCFVTSGYLTAHIRKHRNIRKHKCTYCSKAFFNSTLLKAHITVHTKEKAFQCKVCNTSFARKITLKTHEKLHLDVKSYACKICEKTFKQYAGLYSHIKSHNVAKEELL